MNSDDLNREVRDAIAALNREWTHAANDSHIVYGDRVHCTVTEPWTPGMVIGLPMRTTASNGSVIGGATVHGRHDGRLTIWTVVLLAQDGAAVPHPEVPIPAMEDAHIRSHLSYPFDVKAAS